MVTNLTAGPSAWLALGAGFVLAAAVHARAAVDFERDIRPILAERCYECHGPDKHKGGLRLDRRADALQGGDSGPAIVPHKLDESLLFELVSATEQDDRMPSEGDPLTPAQIALIKDWIEQGAAWPEDKDSAPGGRSNHWAFQPPVRPEVPAVADSRWVANPIDAFVLARLEKEKITPSPEANRVTLIRRLSLDLLGLPPQPEEVRQFVSDRSPNAYERLVDRMLASPHFGERWGRHWLDLARYADSDGYEKDSPRPFAYLFRDWVIDAINRDLPFDHFTFEQLAGDLLVGPRDHETAGPQGQGAKGPGDHRNSSVAVSLESKIENPKFKIQNLPRLIATGFHRQTLTNEEGGVDQEEFRNHAIVDRVSTTGTVWLGLTIGCAECHSHKYDPIRQREFYELFAFFNNADETSVPAASKKELDDYHAAKARWDAELAPIRKIYDDYVRDELPAKLAVWEREGKLELPRWDVLRPESVASLNGSLMTILEDQSVTATGPNPPDETYTVKINGPLKNVRALRLEVLPDPDGKGGPGRAAGRAASRVNPGNFVLSDFAAHVETTGGADFRDIEFARATADFSQRDWSIDAALDGDPTTGWAILPQTGQRHVAVFECEEPLTLKDGEMLVVSLEQAIGNRHTIGRFRLAATSGDAPLKATLHDDAVAAAWHTPANERTERHRAALAAYFRDEIDPGARKLRRPVDALLAKEPRYPTTEAAILIEREQPRETHIHLRGDFLSHGDRVQPGTPDVLHPFVSRNGRPDRLDLARWLMDEKNPLTSRVIVNQFWQNLFGRGLVATVDDFGLRGEKPSHPELLDWLATEFPRTGWSRKAMVKLMAMSSTYRQSSAWREDLAQIDPLNILLARQNRLRVEAEIVRDAHLAASGLLARKIGGPSVRPPLPEDIAALGYASNMKWRESEGEDRYRRGMYIFAQRTVPYPMLTTFDAPPSSTTCTRRERSNTPLQALTLLNDPVFFECAQALGGKAMAEPDDSARLRSIFEHCLSRPPDGEELARLQRSLDRQRRMIAANPKSAAAILGVAEDKLPADAVERASLVAVARIVMNLDEFITRD